MTTLLQAPPPSLPPVKEYKTLKVCAWADTAKANAASKANKVPSMTILDRSCLIELNLDYWAVRAGKEQTGVELYH
jgi:hypothetical protein